MTMASGGSRAGSGPAPDPNSGRSAARGLDFSRLPSEGYSGKVPDFPLPDGSGRELDIWAEAWRTPQAAAWAKEFWRWPVIAEYCRLKEKVEADPAANASLVTQLHRYREQVGLTYAGMAANGWRIAPNEVAARRESKAASTPNDERMSARERRLRAVGDEG